MDNKNINVDDFYNSLTDGNIIGIQDRIISLLQSTIMINYIDTINTKLNCILALMESLDIKDEYVENCMKMLDNKDYDKRCKLYEKLMNTYNLRLDQFKDNKSDESKNDWKGKLINNYTNMLKEISESLINETCNNINE